MNVISFIILTQIKEEEKPVRCVAGLVSLSVTVVLLCERSARCSSYINGGAPEPSRARASEPSMRRIYRSWDGLKEGQADS